MPRRPDLEKLRELADLERNEELREAAEAAREKAIDPLGRTWVAFYLGRAYDRLSRPHAALPEIRDAKAGFEAAGDRGMVAECTSIEASSLHLLDDTTALSVAETALEECRALTPPNRALEARILGNIGSIHVAHHRYKKAVDYYSLAVDAAAEIKDLDRLGVMYNDLGIAYEHLGDLTRARVYAQKAIAIHEQLGDRIAVARAENNLGLVLMKQGHHELARKHLGRSLDICDETGVEVGKGHVLLSLAQLELNGGNFDGASRWAQEALRLAEKNRESAMTAGAHEMLGRIADRAGDTSDADSEFATAFAIFASEQLTDRLVACRATYAQILEARGDIRAAFEQLKLAMAAPRLDS